MSSLLSIQSAVTHGAVGNTMAELVIGRSGHHLCRVDTVQLAAHPGHGFRAGGSLADADFHALLDGITRLGIWPDFAAVMIGYIGRPGQIAPLVAAIADLRRQNSTAPLLLDPAIGDHGRIYVDKAIADGIIAELLPEASILTPNAFELGYLTSSSISDPAAAEAAARHIILAGPRIEGLAVTGIPVAHGIADAWIDRERMVLHQKPALIRHHAGYSGAGDLFAALLVVHWLNGADWAAATAAASALAGDILQMSEQAGFGEISPDAVAATAARIRGRA